MPTVSDKQRRAMHAAAAGKSTIGIPMHVGKEHVYADKLKKKKKKKSGKYGNYTDSGGMSHMHYKPGKKYGGSTTGGGAIGGS